ncbi:hypothetical protein DSOL_2754 [Desulfosporosinus metallidurans]|uniref:Uncharacterized protein n=1 Tax=Desulfosporosinus metallidurans TaxID=1888891 RepID=A0A1Q8QVQ1_9FIRM|nr:hypothetical protein DSOL_2754 [Desulfosporosinus metallidurans]
MSAAKSRFVHSSYSRAALNFDTHDQLAYLTPYKDMLKWC